MGRLSQRSCLIIYSCDSYGAVLASRSPRRSIQRYYSLAKTLALAHTIVGYMAAAERVVNNGSASCQMAMARACVPASLAIENHDVSSRPGVLPHLLWVLHRCAVPLAVRI